MDLNEFLARVQATAKGQGTFQDRGGGRFWLDHATLDDEAVTRLNDARSLTMWNVKVPADFYHRVPVLEALDIRGGSAPDLEPVRDATQLRSLAVNQVRRVTDLTWLTGLQELESLSLYGLSRIEVLPSFAASRRLRSVELGQMRRLHDIRGIAQAPALEELRFVRKLAVTAAGMEAFVGHRSLKRFGWFSEDVPLSQARAVLDALPLPRPTWSAADGGSGDMSNAD